MPAERADDSQTTRRVARHSATTRQVARPGGGAPDEGGYQFPLAALAASGEAHLVFALGEACFAAPIRRVLALRDWPTHLTRVPAAPPRLLGVFPVEGRAFPLFDAGELLAPLRGARERIVLLRAGKLEAAFPVDEVLGIVPLDPAAIVPSEAPCLLGEVQEPFPAAVIDVGALLAQLGVLEGR
ncbi:MAG: chemotaxis protein CheW [Planctomycetota bacterium]